MSKLISDWFGFAQPRGVIGPESSRHLLNQSDSKLERIMIWSLAFSRSYKINFYLNFHILTVEIGQNRNEIDDIKITNNLGSEYYLYLKGYLKRKSPLKIVT